MTEFLTLSRMGFLPHGLVIGSSVYEADTSRQNPGASLWDVLFAGGAAATGPVQTTEVFALSAAVREARRLAVERMRYQAAELHAEGVVGVRLEVEHHLWRGGHQVVKFVAMGTAVAFDHEHGPVEFRGAPSLSLADRGPFMSDLSGQDFVALLRAGYRPITVASGQLRLSARSAGSPRATAVTTRRSATYTGAFFDAREAAMERLQHDLFTRWPPGHPDAPTGIVGMTVTESAHRPQTLEGRVSAYGPQVPVVEFTAVGTAIAPLLPHDPRRSAERPKPRIVVPLDR